MGKTAEVETTISEFLYLPEIRRQEIAKLLEGKCYEKAIGMLNEGIVIAERAGELGIVGEWQEQLLSIYEEMHDVAKLLRCVDCYLFIRMEAWVIIINSNHWCLPWIGKST